MKKTKMLICDMDVSYLRALVGYLMGDSDEYDITCFSDTDGYISSSNTFDVRLLTKDFIGNIHDELLDGDRDDGIKLQDKSKGKSVDIQLLGANDVPEIGMNHLYKFQDMRTFMEKLERFTLKNASKNCSGSDSKLIGVYSPSHNRLKLPFSLVYSNICKNNGKVLLVDLEANSYLNKVVGKDPIHNLTDYMYALSTETAEYEISLGDYVNFYDGLAYMAPVSDPAELWEIEKEQWSQLAAKLKQSPFDVVVIVIGEMGNEINGIMKGLSEIILVEGNDEYAEECMKKYEYYLERKKLNISVQEVRLEDRDKEFGRKFDIVELMHDNPGKWINNVKRYDRVVRAVG
ncbi:MAG: hypothetical protein KBA87_00655 [Lachnospiraceae bacterium]|jgi:hypothetical protein|nr:hypothetical protein [Lachnospiraceae bacterium]